MRAPLLISRIGAALAFVLSLAIFAQPAAAQKTKATVQSEIQTDIPDNVIGAITPQSVRTILGDMVNSWQQYTGVNAQVGTTYAVQQSDYGQLITFCNSSAVAVSLPQPIGGFSTFNTTFANKCAGAVTITPTSSTIGGNSTLVLQDGSATTVVSDGANYQLSTSPPGTYPVTGTNGDLLCRVGGVVGDCGALPGGAVAPSGLTINGGDISTNIPSPNGPTGAQLNIAGTQTGISTDQKNQAIFIGTFFVPGANSQLVEGILQNFTVGASPASLTEVDMFYGAGVTFDSTYNQAVLPSITFFEAQHFTNNSTATSPPFVHQFIADQMATEGNQASLSTYNRLNFWAKGSLVSAASGNTVNNTNYEADLPSGSGAGTTNNIGVLITGAGGAGGAGTTNNWALASTSTADSYFSSRLIIDENTDSLNPELASYPAGTLINVQNADGTAARLLSTAYAATTSFTGLRFDGTKTSPTAVQSGDTVASFDGWAYNGTNIGSGAIASANVQAAQNQTPSANGSKFCIQTTPLGSTTLATGLCQQPSSGVTLGTPTGGDTGAGTINATGYYINGTPLVLGGIPGSSTTGDLLCANGGVVGDCGGLSGAHSPVPIVSSIWSDTTSVLGSPGTFYNPAYYGNAATGLVDHMNRLLVGAAALVSNDLLTGPPQLPTVPGWLDTLFGGPIVGTSQFASGSVLGTLGLTGYSRSSDFSTWLPGQHTGGAQGGTFIGYNDDTGGNPIAGGVFGIAIRKTGVAGVTLNQNDVENAGSVVTETPYGGVTGSSTFAEGFTTGAYSALGTANASAAWYVGQSNTPVFQVGGIFFNGSLNTSIGAGGNGVAMEYARGMSQRWLNSGGTTDAEIWGDAKGLNVNNALVVTGVETLSAGALFPTASAPTFTTGQGVAFGDASDGLVFKALGSVNDFTIISEFGGIALSVPTGTSHVVTGGLVEIAAAPTVAAAQVGFGSTVAATGNCGTLAGDAGCLVINVAGTTRYVPYY